MNGHSLAEAVDGFLESVVAVKRISMHQGVEQFIAFRKGKTVAAEGRRPQLSAEHWRNSGYWLREKEILRLTWQDIFRVPGHIIPLAAAPLAQESPG